MKPTPYVVGFLFRNVHQEVALMTKNRPVWQAGKLNGIGGHIEKGELPLHAMRREFKEETGSWIEAWKCFAVLRGEHYELHCFVSFETPFVPLSSLTDEKVGWYDVRELESVPIIPNLRWLIPMAVDADVISGSVKTV